MTVDYGTGEIVPVDTGSALAVTSYLQQARDWLATAVEETGPEQIARAKAEIATAAEATKQLGLSREIREDATEMVRRAEYALGKSVRKAQEDGGFGTRADGGWTARLQNRDTTLKSTSDVFSSSQERTEIYALSDGVTDEQFEDALSDAKSEGNPSRANVVRKIRGANEGSTLTRRQRADLIAELAEQGYSSRQMPERVGVVEETVRQIARDFGVDIPADKIVGRSRRIDHTIAVDSAVTELDNWASSLTFIDFTEVDFSQAEDWASSLTASLSELRRFIKQIKENAHA